MPEIALSELLRKMIELGGSDLHITTNSAPMVRVHGVLRPLEYSELTPAETARIVASSMSRFNCLNEIPSSFAAEIRAKLGERWRKMWRIRPATDDCLTDPLLDAFHSMHSRTAADRIVSSSAISSAA